MSKTPKVFVGLHSHSGFSTFDGLGYPNEHFDFVLDNQMDAMALTEHGHMNSFAHAHAHLSKLKDKGRAFKYIPGCEFYVHPDLKQWQRDAAAAAEAREAAKAAKKNGEIVPAGQVEEEAGTGLTVENEDETKSAKYYNPVSRRHHLVVLAKNSRGLEKLFGLVSRGYKEGFYKFPRIDYQMLKEAGGDLVVSTACLGGVLSYDVLEEFRGKSFDDLKPDLVNDPIVMNRLLAKMGNTVDKLVDAVGRENFFLEIQFNRLTPQHLVNRCIIEYSKRSGIPLIATADSHYCRPDLWKEREIYKKLGWLNYQSYDPESLPKSTDDLKAELYPKNADQMWQSYKKSGSQYDFYDDALVCDAIERTHGIAHELIGTIEPDRAIKLPSYVIPKGKTAREALVDACRIGMREKGFEGNEVYEERLKTELAVIDEKTFNEYFMTMKSIIDIAREYMLVGCGRGSAAGSLINYVLGITDVDPIKYELLFERFISRARVEPPDIDTDFADRDLLIQLLRSNFGDENVIPISNYNTFKLKSLVKDVSRFWGIPFEEVNEATRTLDEEVRKKVLKQGDDKNLFELKLDDALEHSPKFRAFIDKYPQLAENLKILLHQNKSLGRHAGGVIISERIGERMPLISSKGELQTPWVEGMHYKHLEKFGWIKFDLLGLETMRIIQRAIQLILQRHQGISKPTFAQVREWYEKNLHPSVLDLNDQKVYQHVYCDGRWAGIFQCTQPGAQKFFERAQPKSITDIAALTSIYRPGPLTAKVDDLYIKAKQDPSRIVYEHPLVKQVLEKTYGCIIFQEQLMALGNVVGGMTLDECDKMRKSITKRSMSGKDDAKKETEKLKQIFVKGAVERGLTERVADELFEKIKFFSGYGFNASHAVSYAIDSYQCAWLLTYFEAEWLCAYMESQSGKPETRARAINELRTFGYEVVPVDINYATDGWTILDGKKLMPSLSSFRGVGDAAIVEIDANRPYRDFTDLLWRPDGTWKHSKFNKKGFESMIKMGAFESLGIVGKGKLFENYRQMHHVVVENMQALKHKKTGKIALEQALQQAKELPDWSRSEKIEFYREILGAVDSEILMPSKLRQRLQDKNILSVDESEGGVCWFFVNEASIKSTKTGKKYLNLMVSGEQGHRHRIFCWGWGDRQDLPQPFQLFLADLQKSDFGFSTYPGKLRRVGIE